MHVIIEGLGRVPAQAPAVRLRGAGVGFAVPVERMARAAPTAPTVALDGMLALQEQEADATRDRQARQHGHALLHALAALQHALLAGTAEAAPLQHLAALAEASPEAADPQLGAIIQALALRARVELARRGL